MIKTQLMFLREAIGSLMFLALVTRPDIAFAVNVVNRYVNNHKNNHWMTVKRIFKFSLPNTIGCGLLYENQDKNNEVLDIQMQTLPDI